MYVVNLIHNVALVEDKIRGRLLEATVSDSKVVLKGVMW